ncbi:MAG: ABC transporter ATP-binding protein, partial [Tissierellia bacterium]|nr:ABC transporter ATP-binding protein [Tissierellia bacterium]
KLAIALILVLILCGILASWMFTSESKFMDIYQDALKVMSAQTVEYIRGIQIIKIFKTNVESFKKLHNSIKDYSKYAYKYSKLCKLPFVLFQWIFYGSVAILMIPIVLNLKRLDPYNELILNIIMFLFLSGLILVSIMGIMYAGMYMYEANYAVDNLEKIYKEMDENKIRFGNDEVFKNYDIKFDHVDFSYGSKKVFEDFSVEFKQNKIYALVGESGCGKSTLVKLLSGFYNLDDGRILIGEKPIEKYSKNALSKNIAFVFQDSKLFNMSIYDNLKIAKEDATDKEIKRAIKLSYCDKFINNLPNGINTIIGEKGVYLSGGEKQRIAIARAILKNSPIIILDEASSAIDSDNEYKIQRAFSELMKNKTVIMIAHRLSSIKNVDEIIVLKDSKIIQRGNHKDLIKENSQYKKQFEMYEKANEWRL